MTMYLVKLTINVNYYKTKENSDIQLSSKALRLVLCIYISHSPKDADLRRAHLVIFTSIKHIKVEREIFVDPTELYLVPTSFPVCLTSGKALSH